MEEVKIAVLDIVVTLTISELVRMRKELSKERNSIMKAGRQRNIDNLEKYLNVIMDELHTIKTERLLDRTIKVGGSD